MPELPEVETIRRQLAPRLTGRTLGPGAQHPSPKFSTASLAEGATVTELTRRGKYLVIGLERAQPWAWGPDAHLIVHLGMTGSLRVRDDPPDSDPYVRAWWAMDDAALVFRDVRRFGRIAVVPPGNYAALPTLAALGPEPTDATLDAEVFWRSLRRSRRALKTQILSQRPVAGVGNIYADEAFWAAGVNPADRSISRDRAARLLEAIREALHQGIQHGGTTLRDYVDADGDRGANQVHLLCYGRAGQPCRRCGDVLRSRSIDARTTTWCPTCQPRR